VARDPDCFAEDLGWPLDELERENEDAEVHRTVSERQVMSVALDEA
jgi:hypothetical protein